MSGEIAPEWGAVYEGGTLSLSVTPPADEMSTDRVRFGRTVLELRARSRPERVVVQVAVRFGPALPVRIGLATDAAWQVMVDETVIVGRAAKFVATHEHEVQFLAAGSW